MGLKVEPAYIGQAGYDHPVELDRNLLEGVFSRSGSLRYGDFALSPGVGTRAVAVAPGRRFLLGAENAQQGGYFVWSDGIDTSLLAAAVGNPRVDTFILRVIDNQYGVISGSPRAEIQVVQGVAGAAPVARPNSDFNVGGSFYIPGAWDRLGDVRVNVADTGSIPGGQFYNPHNYVRVNGHCIGNVTPSTTGFGGFPSDPLPGDTFDALDQQGCRFRYDGSAWVAGSQRLAKVKAALQNAPLSNTTLQDDTDLFFSSLPINSGWEVRGRLWYTAGTTGDLKVGWSGPAGATLKWTIGGLASSVSSNVGDMYVGQNDINGTDIVTGFASNAMSAQVIGILRIGSTPGTFRLRFAQGTSDGGSFTTLLADSALILDRLY